MKESSLFINAERERIETENKSEMARADEKNGGRRNQWQSSIDEAKSGEISIGKRGARKRLAAHKRRDNQRRQSARQRSGVSVA